MSQPPRGGYRGQEEEEVVVVVIPPRGAKMAREPVSDVPRYRCRVDTRLYEINELFLPTVRSKRFAILPIGSSRSFSQPALHVSIRVIRKGRERKRERDLSSHDCRSESWKRLKFLDERRRSITASFISFTASFLFPYLWDYEKSVDRRPDLFPAR